MTINVSQALNHQFEAKPFTYTQRDAALYALSIGAAADPMDEEALRYVYELHSRGMRVFPTFAAAWLFSVFDQLLSVPGLEFNPVMLLHGEHYLEVKRPLPVSAAVANQATISQIYDKGKGALVILEISSRDKQGDEIAVNRAGMFIRGLGGFGGERGPSGPANRPPQREADAVHRAPTAPNQALFYRLAGSDPNPLHADPNIAAMAGFDRPILHGLCTFGVVARAALETFADNDPARFKSIQARFSKHVFPGETIVTEMWQEGDDVICQARVAERDQVALSHARVKLEAGA
jgi:acyl dehydratase